MARHYLIVLRDIVANVYGAPMTTPTLGAAIRSFGDACSAADGKTSDVSKHPEDYELYHVGYWDDSDGTFLTEGDEDEKGHVIDRVQIAIGRNYKRQ